jgi:hypothetical protein
MRAGRDASRWSPARRRSTAVVARLVRRTQSELTWLEIVSEEGRDLRMVVTIDSARLLLAVLQDLLSLGRS